MADNTLNYDAATVNSLLGIVDTNKGAFPLDTELSATSAHAVENKAVYAAVRRLENATVKNKGYYKDAETLQTAHRIADTGDIAYVGAASPYRIYAWGDNGWADTGSTYVPEIDLNGYPTKAEMEEMKTATETAAAKAEQMAAYTDAAKDAAEKANAAAAKAESASMRLMTYAANVSATESSLAEVGVNVDIPNVPSLPKLLVLTASVTVNSTAPRTVTVACHRDGNTGYLFGAAVYLQEYAVNVATNDYDEETLSLFVTASKVSSATVKLEVTDVSILY